MLLIYASCVVVPFAVATAAYAFRTVLSTPSAKTRTAGQGLTSLTATTALAPSAETAPHKPSTQPAALLPSK
jgi:tetrahydromethanopterin S-methyltransferase subunit D